MLKLARRARGHFVTLIEIRVHLIRVKPGQICNFQPHKNISVHVLVSITDRKSKYLEMRRKYVQ